MRFTIILTRTSGERRNLPCNEVVGRRGYPHLKQQEPIMIDPDEIEEDTEAEENEDTNKDANDGDD